MSRQAHSLKFQISTLLFSTVLSMLSVPAVARTATVYCPGNSVSSALKYLDPQNSNTIRIHGTCRESGVVIDGNSEASFWGGGTFTGNQPIDLYCATFNGIAAAPQLATVGITNCPNSY